MTAAPWTPVPAGVPMVLAVLLAAASAGLLAGRPRRPLSGSARPRLRERARGRPLAVVAAGATATLPLWLEGRRLALVLVAVGAALGLSTMVGRGRAARAAERRRAAVVEVAEALAGELRAGQPPQAALERSVDVWPELEPVAAAGRLGADVAAALRRVAGQPGADGLAEVASAWLVSGDSGAALSVALEHVAATARTRQATRHVVAAELASARATARLVALLPLAVLAMASGVGGRPWGFLLDTPAGIACLAGGVVLVLTGLWWIDRIAAAVQRR